MSSHQQDMVQLWKRLEELAARTPKSLFLRRGAGEAAVRAAERTMGIDFPADFRASLLVHDGQEWDADGADDAFEWLPGQGRLASLERIVEEWRTHQERFEEFSPGGELEEIDGGRLYHVFWHPRRIPIAGNTWWDQDNLYLDMIPGPRGTVGQLAVFGKGVFGEVRASGFGVAVARYVEALERGSR